MKPYGTLWGVGVGPGDPQLITFKAADILRRSTVIAYVVDEKGESFARQTAAAHFAPHARELPLHFSMSPNRTDRLAARAEAARQTLAFLSQGQDVTFIAEGDPLLYSTFQHLLAALPSEAPVEICPGVSSLTATAAEAGFPLALESERMLVVTASTDTMQNLPGWLEAFEVIILFKVHRHITTLKEILKGKACLDKAVVVQHASLGGQARVIHLADWNGEPLPYFSMLLIRTTEGV
jgi:precorrin-2/cobalt-factor-2 C20-methyltransferase